MIRISAPVTLLSFVFAIINVHAQSTYDRTDMLKVIDSNMHKAYKASYPITRDTLNQYPDSLEVEGLMVDYSLLGFPCGYFCGCGAIKIKLISANPLYKEEFIYVGMPCFNVLPDLTRQQKKWKVYKIPLKDNSCYWTEVPINKFDSKGIPFYTMH